MHPENGSRQGTGNTVYLDAGGKTEGKGQLTWLGLGDGNAQG